MSLAGAVSRELAEFVAGAAQRDLPEAVRAATYRAMLDWFGSALAGSIEPPARHVQVVARGLGDSSDATMFGAGRGSAAAAALANGVASHILELDDVHKGSTLHAAAPVIPAALAVAEREHCDGAALTRAVALGYDVALRIGEAVNPSHYRFWHPTGTAATFGAAAAAGALLRLDGRAMLDALGTAGTQAAGLWEFNADGAMSKHLHPGKAAMNGVLAADLAAVGFTGATRILEGDRGFFRAMATHADPSRVTDGLGQHWKITENCFKLHACCGHTHTAVDLALDARAQRGWRTPAEVVDAIARIEIQTYGPGWEIVRDPHPGTPYRAKFSIAYCTAAALLEGQVGLDQFSDDRFDGERVTDASIAALLARTEITVRSDLTQRYPAAWPARLIVTMCDGTSVPGESDFPRGNPENPVTTDLLESKLESLVGSRVGTDVAARALAAVREIEACDDVARLFASFGTLARGAPAHSR